MNLFKRIMFGTVSESIYKRIMWLYAAFFLLFYSVTIISYFIFPEGILRGKHPLISNLDTSPNLWLCMLQIAGYNFIPLLLIISANLLAQKSRIIKDKFIPTGYNCFWVITIIFALYLGTWSFEVVTPAPILLTRLVQIFDVTHHSGIIEMSAYLLAAAVSYRCTLWYSDRKMIVISKRMKDISLTEREKGVFILAFLFIFISAFIEAYNIVHAVI